MFTSRGCPGGCTYCYNCTYHKRKWRSQSSDVALENLRRLYVEGINNIILTDEYFFNDIDRSREICSKLIESKIKIKFYYTNCKISQIVKMSDDDLELFSNAGFNDLFIGIETGSERMQKLIKKYIKLDDVIPTGKRLIKHGVCLAG